MNSVTEQTVFVGWGGDFDGVLLKVTKVLPSGDVVGKSVGLVVGSEVKPLENYTPFLLKWKPWSPEVRAYLPQLSAGLWKSGDQTFKVQEDFTAALAKAEPVEEEDDTIQTYVCHECCRSTNQSDSEREKYDPLCKRCWEACPE